MTIDWKNVDWKKCVKYVYGEAQRLFNASQEFLKENPQYILDFDYTRKTQFSLMVHLKHSARPKRNILGKKDGYAITWIEDKDLREVAEWLEKIKSDLQISHCYIYKDRSEGGVTQKTIYAMYYFKPDYNKFFKNEINRQEGS